MNTTAWYEIEYSIGAAEQDPWYCYGELTFNALIDAQAKLASIPSLDLDHLTGITREISLRIVEMPDRKIIS